MSDNFDLTLMVRDSLADWRAQLAGRFPRLGKSALRFLSVLCAPLALRFALQMRKFHARIGSDGLGAASLELLKRYYAGVSFSEEGGRPRARHAEKDPLLVLANHPGVVDSLALLYVLEEEYGIRDVRMVANERDFFTAMPYIRSRIITVPAENSQRVAVLGRIEDALSAGSSVILYPSGDITNDPCLAPDVYSYDGLLGAWSPSVGLLLARARRRVQRGIGRPFTVQPVLCGGVLPPGSGDARWMGRGRSRRDREASAVISILALGTARRETVRVRAGRPFDLERDFTGLSPKEMGTAVYRSALETVERLAREIGAQMKNGRG